MSRKIKPLMLFAVILFLSTHLIAQYSLSEEIARGVIFHKLELP